MILTDHVVVEHLAYVARPRDPVPRLDERCFVLLTDNVHAELDTFVADEDGRSSNQLSDLVLALATKRAVEGVLRVATAGFGHRHSVTGGPAPGSKYMCSWLINNQLIIRGGAYNALVVRRAPRLFETFLRFVAAGSIFYHLVDQPELLCLEWGQELVTLQRGLDRFKRLAGMLDIDLVEARPQG